MERLARIGTATPFARMAKAIVASLAEEEEGARERPERRVSQWLDTVTGVASGLLDLGTRPIDTGEPEWVPDAAPAGFLAGFAEIAPEPWERSLARRAGVPPTRRGLFAHHLGEAGLLELDAMLESGGYDLRRPEEAGLLVVAWLVGEGDLEAAVALAEELAPLAGRLRFVPRPAEPAGRAVFLESVGEARARLAGRRESERVAAQREALTVWNPLADDLLSLWLQTRAAGALDEGMPPGWHARAAALLERYRELAATHTRCGKHRRANENLAILLRALETVAAGRELEPRQAGLLRRAMDAMVARRSEPGSPAHRALREAQAAVAARPGHDVLARIVAARLGDLPQAQGAPSLAPLLAPVSALEAQLFHVPERSAIPPAIQAIVRRTLAGMPQELIAAGVVPSVETLAGLAPRLAAEPLAVAYGDDRLRRLMAATYVAFREHAAGFPPGIGFVDLPWVEAASAYRTRPAAGRDAAHAALAGLARLSLETFPGSPLPGALVAEMAALAREARLDLPLVDGARVGDAVALEAARVAGRALRGSLYERYYGIDYGAVLTVVDDLGALCRARAGARASRDAVAEQSRILTTHNLTVLVEELNLRIDRQALARRAFQRVLRLARRLATHPRPERVLRDLADAWRQALFFLSPLRAAEIGEFLAWARPLVAAQPAHARAVLTPTLNGMRDLLGSGTFDAQGMSSSGRRLVAGTAGL